MRAGGLSPRCHAIFVLIGDHVRDVALVSAASARRSQRRAGRHRAKAHIGEADENFIGLAEFPGVQVVAETRQFAGAASITSVERASTPSRLRLK